MRAFIALICRIALGAALLALAGCGDSPGDALKACKPADRACLFAGARALFVDYAKNKKINTRDAELLVAAAALAGGADGARSAAKSLAADLGSSDQGLWAGYAVLTLARAGRNELALAIFDGAAAAERNGVRLAACAKLAAHFALAGDGAAAQRFADCALEMAGPIDPRERRYDDAVVAAGWARGLPAIQRIYRDHFQRTGTAGDPVYSALLTTLQTWKSIELGEAVLFHAGDPALLTRGVEQGGRRYEILRTARDYAYYAAIAPFAADLGRLRRGEGLGAEALARPARMAGARQILAALAATMAARYAREGQAAPARAALRVFDANAAALLGPSSLQDHHNAIAVGDYAAARVKLGDDRKAILDRVLGPQGEHPPEHALGLVRAGDAALARLAAERLMQRFAALAGQSGANEQLAFRVAAMAALLAAAFPG